MSKIITGTVHSLKMNKTVVVSFEEKYTHPVYKKILKRSKKFKAHYEGNDLKVGDKVSIQETRPVSKTKHWKVIKSK